MCATMSNEFVSNLCHCLFCVCVSLFSCVFYYGLGTFLFFGGDLCVLHPPQSLSVHFCFCIYCHGTLVGWFATNRIDKPYWKYPIGNWKDYNLGGIMFGYVSSFLLDFFWNHITYHLTNFLHSFIDISLYTITTITLMLLLLLLGNFQYASVGTFWNHWKKQALLVLSL